MYEDILSAELAGPICIYLALGTGVQQSKLYSSNLKKNIFWAYNLGF